MLLLDGIISQINLTKTSFLVQLKISEAHET